MICGYAMSFNYSSLVSNALLAFTMQGNARRLLDKRCDGNSRLGRLSKLGLAPLLWCIIFVLLVVYINAVIMGIYTDLCILS